MSDYIYIPGNLKNTNGPNGPVTRIVIHATVSPCEVGGARSVARYFQSDSAGGLAHYVVDPSEVVCCCHEHVLAYHAPPNKGSIGVELCDPQTGAVERWYDDLHRQMLQRAAVLVADLCERHQVPVTFLSPADLSAGKHGVTTHANVSIAFRQSSHTDPGSGFPIAHFLDLVRAAQNKPVPVPTPPAPAPAPVQEDDMAVLIKGSTTKVWVTNGVTKRWVQNQAELRTLIDLGVVAAQIHKVDDAVISAITEA